MEPLLEWKIKMINVHENLDNSKLIDPIQEYCILNDVLYNYYIYDGLQYYTNWKDANQTGICIYSKECYSNKLKCTVDFFECLLSSE